MPSKKSKVASPKTTTPGFVDSLWENFWGLADDSRIELHKQVQALISLADSSLQGATGFVNKQNDRLDELARQGIVTANQAGRTLVATGRRATRELLASYRSSTTQIVTGARDNVRSVADRASATARVMVASSDEEKAA